MEIQKRDIQGRFVSDNPKTIIMRVTKQEKQLVEKFRQIQPSKKGQRSQFINELQALIRKRVNNLEL